MVKKLDDIIKKLDELDPRAVPGAKDVGVALWHAASVWRAQLQREMVARGHAWYGDARSIIAMHLDPGGLPQSALVARTGLSKQAVQQLLDGLEADGIIARLASTEDKRSKRVVYTKKGRASVKDALAVKRQLETDFEDRLGAKAFEALRGALEALG